MAAGAIVTAGSLAMLALAFAVVTLVVGSLHRRASAATAASLVASSPPPQGTASPLAPAPAPDAVPVASADSPVAEAPHSTAPFSASAAKHAFDAVSRQVAACKRGMRWGVANATVTFDTDGSVKQVVVGPPFAGTATGRCVGDSLGGVHIPPFGGDPVVYITRFYVAPR